MDGKNSLRKRPHPPLCGFAPRTECFPVLPYGSASSALSTG